MGNKVFEEKKIDDEEDFNIFINSNVRSYKDKTGCSNEEAWKVVFFENVENFSAIKGTNITVRKILYNSAILPISSYLKNLEEFHIITRLEFFIKNNPHIIINKCNIGDEGRISLEIEIV
jgi:hypothetical protein